jgi:hypothetical protein
MTGSLLREDDVWMPAFAGMTALMVISAFVTQSPRRIDNSQQAAGIIPIEIKGTWQEYSLVSHEASSY